MCRAEATLVYGLTVRSASLVFAADAWTRLQHSFRFFDLVFLRRRKGGLVSSTDMGDGPVTRLPNEVWEEIRHWLVKEELAGAQDSLLGPLFCVDPTCQLRPPHWERVTWLNYTAMNFDHCYGCEGGADEFYRDAIQNWDEPHRSCDMRSLLSNFGLALPLDKAIHTETDWTFLSDRSVLALISAPSAFGEDDSGETCTTAECGGDTNPDEHTIVDVSFQNLPSDIDQRFERFIKLFDLQVVESSVNKLSPKSSKSRNKEEEENKATTEAKPKNGVRDEVSKKIKPVWKLYSTCVTTW
ncbi:uncharacterized protein JCM6883_004440 [Sporobolomyces salmoneus]|uniref:uncharacterized protein n=1 Tax=Sporobolomyces salmoneus TaxID=183962 RepID=UPI0031800FF1